MQQSFCDTTSKQVFTKLPLIKGLSDLTNGISQNSLQWHILKNENFFVIFYWAFSVWTRKATFCFLNSLEYFWLKSGWLIPKFCLKLYSFRTLMLFTYHTWYYLYSQQNTTPLST